jgi:hypothetical protein
MASPFARAFAAAAVTHDNLAGESFTFLPQKFQTDRNAPMIGDPSRAIVAGVRVPFGDSAARAGAGPFHQVGVQPERPGHASARPYISLDLVAPAVRAAQGRSRVARGNRHHFSDFRGVAVNAGLCAPHIERNLSDARARLPEIVHA